jgi:hypothetical protein
MLEIPDPDLSFGGAKREADGLYVNGVVAPAALPAREITFAEIASEVQKRGIAVTLPEVARWTPELRTAVCDWLRGGGEKATIPSDLALYVSRRTTHALVDVNKEQAPAPKVTPPPVATTYSPKEDVKPPNVPLIATANKGAGINPDMQKIIEVIFAADAFKDYADLEGNLEIGEDRGDYRTLMLHLDKAEQRARRAHRLYLGAKIELAGWEQDSKKVMGAMRQDALTELEEEKKTGDLKKRIANADVDAKMSEIFADEYAAQAMTLAKLRCTTEHLERIAELWKGRCHTLGTMLSNLRK